MRDALCGLIIVTNVHQKVSKQRFSQFIRGFVIDYNSGGCVVPSLPNLCTQVACRRLATYLSFILCVLELLVSGVNPSW